MIDPDTPEILRQFLAYHETIKGQSPKTIDEYHLDLRMFLRFLVLMRSEMPIDTDLETISVRHVDVEFLRSVTTNDIFDFLSYLARERRTQDGSGLGASARARKLSAIKSFFKYLTTRTKLLDENPAQDIEYPRMRRALPKYLTLEESRRLLAAVDGPNRVRDYAILMLFLNCGIRRAELVGLNRNDVYNDRIRVTGKGNKERFVYFGETTREALDSYLPERNKIVLDDDRALFGSRDHRRLSVTAVHRLVKKHHGPRHGEKAAAGGRTGQHPVFLPQVAPHRRHADGRKRRGPQNGAGGARPRAPEHDGDLHPHRKYRAEDRRRGQSPLASGSKGDTL